MSRDTIEGLLQKKPFQPFVVRLSNGEEYEVAHPEFAILLKTNLVIGFPDSDRFVWCSLMHINSAEPLEPAIS